MTRRVSIYRLLKGTSVAGATSSMISLGSPFNSGMKYARASSVIP